MQQRLSRAAFTVFLRHVCIQYINQDSEHEDRAFDCTGDKYTFKPAHVTTCSAPDRFAPFYLLTLFAFLSEIFLQRSRSVQKIQAKVCAKENAQTQKQLGGKHQILEELLPKSE